MVQTFASNRADQAFDIGILPRRSRSCADFVNADPLGCLMKLVAVASVTIMEQIARSAVPGESLQELLSSPCGRGMLGYGVIHETSAVMRKDQKDE